MTRRDGTSRSGGRGAGRAALRALAAGAALLALLPAEGRAQFGRNKVQYHSFDFQIIETVHFDIYFYEEERQAALDAARMAERIYGRLSRILDHEFRDRKPIILYASQSDFQQTNILGGFVGEATGGVTEGLKDRVVLPLTGSYAEFEHVLAHELVHAFQFDVLKRSAVEQTASPFAFFPSLWFMEGMAEYLSVGTIDAKTTAWLRDAALDGYLRTIEEMNRFDDFLSYRFGQSLWNYVGAKWGDETVGLLLKRAASLGTERAFQRTLGVTLAELTAEWHEAVRATYLPGIARADAVHRTARRVTTHAFPRGRGKSPSYIAPALSPDGQRLVYLSDQGHDLYTFYDLWLADAETGEPLRRLVKSARTADFESLRYLTSSADFSPDGSRVAFVARTGGRDAIYVIHAGSGEVERRWVPPLNGVQTPSWSPDGRRIAFTGLLGGLSNLYVWDLETDEMRALTSDRHARLHPSWSPDGRRIAFATDEGPVTDFDRLVFGNLRIAVYDLETGGISLLPGLEEGDAINPVWSPDGRGLAFLSTRTGVFNVFLWDEREGRLLQLTDALTGAMGEGALLTSPGLSWARGADRLAFSYFEQAGHNIYVVDDPWAAAREPAPAGRAPTAATQIGAPRLVEGGEWVDVAEEAGETPSSFYLTDEGFRRSDFDPALREAVAAAPGRPGRISVTALMDSASLALPDTATFLYRDYRVSLTPDIVGRPQVGAEVGGFFGNGVYAGSFITLSDMLGDHNLVLAGDVQGSFDNARLFTSYAYLKNRINFGISFLQFPLFRFRGRRFGEVPDEGGGTGEFNVFQRDQWRQVAVDARYPLSQFSRFEFGLAAASIETDSIFQGIKSRDLRGFTVELDGPTQTFVRPSVAWIHDNSLPGFTGRLGGRRWRIDVSPALGEINLADVLGDFRTYAPLPGPLVFATRLLSFTRFGLNSGEDAREFELAWGGPYFLRGYDFGSYSFEECEASQLPGSPVFCPAQEQLIGSSILLLNAEVRFPVLNPVLMSWLPLNFPPIDGSLFFDIGAAFTPGVTTLVWDRGPNQDPTFFREPLTSYGIGLRFNLYFAILRLDYTVAPSRHSGLGNGIWSLSFGEMF